MRVFGLHPKLFDYQYLPLYCRFIIEQKLDAFVAKQLELAREIQLPIMERLQHLSDEQILQISKVSLLEYLTYLSNNKAKEQIESSLRRWVTDQLELIGKFELLAEDITLINFVRNQTFQHFLPQYTQDLTHCLGIISELDSFFTASVTAATDTYILLLKERVSMREQELLEAQQIAHIGNFEWDIQNNSSKNSSETLRIYGIDHELHYEEFLEHVHPDDREQLQHNLQKAFTEGSYEAEYRFINNGVTKYIWSKGIIHFEQGKPAKMIGTIQDITNRKKAEKELTEKTIALERSNESLQQFAYVASHDLKEPIRKIATFTDMVLIQEQQLSASSKENLTKVFSSAVRMRQMIDDIMAYSTLTQWEDKVLFPLEKVVQEAVEILEQAIADKKAVVTFTDLPEICAVPSQIRQLFQNLIANALKFSKPDVPPQITIKSAWLNKEQVETDEVVLVDKYLQLQIADNGIGFEQESSEKIFALFSRLHGKGQYDGSGLGLAIVKRIVDNHGGLVTAQGEKGKGALFTIILPQ